MVDPTYDAPAVADVYPRRDWWPAELLDEVMPPGRRDPDEWLIGSQGDIYAIANGEEASEGDGDGVLMRIRPRDLVKFCYVDRFGTIGVTFRPDGTYLTHGTLPSGYNYCWLDDDHDSAASGLEELASFMVLNGILGEGERHAVQFAYWSDEVERELFIGKTGPRFTLPDGTRRAGA